MTEQISKESPNSIRVLIPQERVFLLAELKAELTELEKYIAQQTHEFDAKLLSMRETQALLQARIATAISLGVKEE